MKKIIKIQLIIFCILLIGCTKNKVDNSTTNYYIIDTVNSSGNFNEMTWLENDSYPILYLGILSDTIYIDHSLQNYPVPPPPSFGDSEEISNKKNDFISYDSIDYQKALSEYKEKVRKHPLQKFNYEIESILNLSSIYVDSTIEIKVDTNLTISKFNEGNFFEAYPVIISNLSKDTLLIGYKGNIAIIVEAKDSLNNWSKIVEFRENHGLPLSNSYMLNPGLFAITSTYKTIGNYKTRLRIKIGNNYSNEWSGLINYNQFNSIFDDEGNYKNEYLKQKK